MDAFIESFSNLSKQLLPILGLAVLVCLVILLIKLIKIFKNLNVTVDKANITIDLTNQTIDKIQAPLNTAVKISGSVDKAYDATVEAVSAAKDFVVEKVDDIKDKVATIMNSEDKGE